MDKTLRIYPWKKQGVLSLFQAPGFRHGVISVISYQLHSSASRVSPRPVRHPVDYPSLITLAN